MAAEVKKEIELEIAHVLFVDIVAYSKMAIDGGGAGTYFNAIAPANYITYTAPVPVGGTYHVMVGIQTPRLKLARAFA